MRPPREIFSGQVPRRRHHEGEDNDDLAVGIGEPGKLFLFPDDIHRVHQKFVKPAFKDFLFLAFPVVEGNAFRCFTEPHHGIAEVRFQFLLQEIEAYQFMAHFVGKPGADDRIGQGRPYQVAVHMEGAAEEDKGQGLRQGPEDKDEAEDGGHRPKEAGHEGQGAGGKKVDVFGNTLIRVVGAAAGKHFQPVEHLPGSPAGKVLFRHPPPPAESQGLLQVVGIHGKGNVSEGDGGEADKAMIYGAAVIILQGAVKLIEPVIQKKGHVHRRHGEDHNAQKVQPGTLLLFTFPIPGRELPQSLHRLPVPLSRNHSPSLFLRSIIGNIFYYTTGGKAGENHTAKDPEKRDCSFPGLS